MLIVCRLQRKEAEEAAAVEAERQAAAAAAAARMRELEAEEARLQAAQAGARSARGGTVATRVDGRERGRGAGEAEAGEVLAEQEWGAGGMGPGPGPAAGSEEHRRQLREVELQVRCLQAVTRIARHAPSTVGLWARDVWLLSGTLVGNTGWGHLIARSILCCIADSIY